MLETVDIDYLKRKGTEVRGREGNVIENLNHTQLTSYPIHKITQSFQIPDEYFLNFIM